MSDHEVVIDIDCGNGYHDTLRFPYRDGINDDVRALYLAYYTQKTHDARKANLALTLGLESPDAFTALKGEAI